jgi:hypothetical protein
MPQAVSSTCAGCVGVQVDPTAAQEVKASLGSLSAAGDAEADETVSHLQRIAELEREVKRLRQVSRCAAGASRCLPGRADAMNPRLC